MKTTTAGRLRNLLFRIPPAGEVVFVLPDGRTLELELTEAFDATTKPGPRGKPVQVNPARLLLGLKECPPATAGAAA